MRKKCNIHFKLFTYYEFEDGINEYFNLKRLSLFIENDLKDDIVIIFAEPSLKVIWVMILIYMIQVSKVD